MTSSAASKKKRVRVWTPEDRAAHRVFEKSRREAFNDSLLDLARHIPTLAGTRRLNKHKIVEHSISQHQRQRQLCLSTLQDYQALLAERDELLAEVNQWRCTNPSLPPREARPSGQHLQELLKVEQETFGSFPNGFGDNGPEEGSGDDYVREQPDAGPTGDEGISGFAVGSMPRPEVLLPTRNPAAIPPSNNFEDILDLPSDLDVQDPNLFTFDGLLDLDGPLDYGTLLENGPDPQLLPHTNNGLASHQGDTAPTSDSDAAVHTRIQSHFQVPMTTGNNMQSNPYLHAMFESFNQMQQPYAQDNVTRHPSFPT